MGFERQWEFADHSALEWIETVGSVGTSYTVGPLPDKVFILHPLLEHIDGLRLDQLDDDDIEDDDDPRLRTLRWDDYARRKNISMFGEPGGYLGEKGPLSGVIHDRYVRPPGEGDIMHAPTEHALFDILIRHSSAGEHTMCTAYLSMYLGSEPGPKQPDGQDNYFNVQRGPLGAAWPELYNDCDFVTPPQNLWPDDHAWVLETDFDGWMTALSGSTDLIEDVLASPALEARRQIQDLH